MPSKKYAVDEARKDEEQVDEESLSSQRKLIALHWEEDWETDWDCRFNAVFQQLVELAEQIGDEPWEGEVFVYMDTTPSLSVLGALAQLRQYSPSISVSVAFEGGPDEFLEARPLSPAAFAPSLAAELEEAVRRVIKAEPAGTGEVTPTKLVGRDPCVKKLWHCVRATGKALRRKRSRWKNEREDKMKYFFHHRPWAFEVHEEERRYVTLAPRGGAAHAKYIAETTAEVEKKINKLLKTGHGVRGLHGAEGFVFISQVGDDKGVKRKFQRCRFDEYDWLSFFLSHCDNFEVWPPQRGRHTDYRHLRQRVRLWPELCKRKTIVEGPILGS